MAKHDQILKTNVGMTNQMGWCYNEGEMFHIYPYLSLSCSRIYKSESKQDKETDEYEFTRAFKP